MNQKFYDIEGLKEITFINEWIIIIPLVVLIIGGFWWYRNRKPAPAPQATHSTLQWMFLEWYQKQFQKDIHTETPLWMLQNLPKHYTGIIQRLFIEEYSPNNNPLTKKELQTFFDTHT